MKVQTSRERKWKRTTDSGVSPLAGHNRSVENSRPETLAFIEEIHRRAKTMTPMLKQIIEFRP
jgi:hypothetical protein